MKKRSQKNAPGAALVNEMQALADRDAPVKVGDDQTSLAPDDMDYVSDCKALLQRQSSGWRGGILLVAIIAVISFLVWADWAELDEVSRGMGKVIPSSSIQVIQSLEGGILETIDVEEGEVVEKGQMLLRIRDTIYSAAYQENEAKRQALEARMARLMTEVDGGLNVKFPDGIRQDLVVSEGKLFKVRLADYDEIRGALLERLALVQRELSLLNESREKGAISVLEYLRVEKEITELTGQLSTMETRRKRESMEAYDIDKAELDALVHAIKRDKDRLDRTVIYAPVAGTINEIYIDTVGRVIQSGVDIMDIVPAEDALMIEANVSPADIAFIRPGQKATVKFTAYDFAVYGGLEGEVEHIGANTITDEEGNSFYQVKVRTEKSTLGEDRRGEKLDLIPGMVAEVDVLTGRKTVLSYLLNPFTRAKERAMREK